MSILEFVAATFAVIAGSVVQVASGVGGGFVIVPLLAFVDMSLIPGPLIFASLSLSGLMATRDHASVNWAHIPITLAGLIPGSIAGAYVLTTIPPDQLGMVFGIVLLIGIVATVSGLKIPLTRFTALVSGALAGAMGTSSGIGAPMLALLYQNETGSRIRGTLAVLYTGASVLILIILSVFGKFTLDDIRSGFLLMPGFVLGFWAANHVTAHIDRAGTRIVVLSVSTAAAIGLIIRSI
jgi:uncharacterized membrane protein YfcA